MDDFKKEESKGSMWKRIMRRIARHKLKQKDIHSIVKKDLHSEQEEIYYG